MTLRKSNLLIDGATMDINEEQLRNQWSEAIRRMAAQIDDFKARVDTESQALYSTLSAEIASLQSDLKNLELEGVTADSDAYARRIARLIEHLRAQGEAAYQLLESTLPTHPDPTDIEIRRLEALEAAASDEAKAAISSRIDELRSARAASQTAEKSTPVAEQSR